MQNPIHKFRKSSVISENPGYFSEKFKTLTSSNYRNIYYFLLKFCKRFLLKMSTKGCLGFFLFCLDLESLIEM